MSMHDLFDGSDMDLIPCSVCGGSGIIASQECTFCDGENALQTVIDTTDVQGISTAAQERPVLSMSQFVSVADYKAAKAAQEAKDAARLDALRDNCWGLIPVNVPTGGDDYDVRWQVIEYQERGPDRTIAQSFTDNPRDAIDAALSTAQAKEGAHSPEGKSA